jgi:excinuclease UvrABC nuclease subunit
MTRYLTTFCHREPDGIIEDIFEANMEEIPAKSGVYIIVSRDKSFIYPRSTSPVIYIGMSNNLQRRLRDHIKAINMIKSQPPRKRNELWWYSRYQYIVANGAKVYWLRTRGLQDQRNLERMLLDAFYNYYLAIPVGNGAIQY